MKVISKKFVLTIFMVALSFLGLKAGVPEAKNDPRIQNRDNRVTVALLNPNQDVVTVRIYSSKNKLIHEEVLANDTQLIGKMFDFASSARGFYRITLVSGEEKLLEKRLFLGKL